MSPENQAQFEYQRMQLIGSLNTVSNSMRECAAMAEHFAGIIAGVPYMGNPGGFPALANGQYAMPVMAPMGHDESGKKRKSRGEDAEGKRRAKKPKDPNAPKRPASSYLLFQNDVRNELKAKNPGMRNNELLSAIAKLWAEMPQEQKDAYENRNKALKDRWREEKAAYESAGKGEGPATPVAAAVPAIVAPAPAKAAPVAVPAVTEESSEEETHEEEPSSDSSEEEDDDEEEEEAAPPPKKSKKEIAAVPAAKDDGAASKKEKKHKKSKA